MTLLTRDTAMKTTGDCETLTENKGVHTGAVRSGPAPAEPLTWHYVFRLGTGRDQIEDLRRTAFLAGV